VPLLTFEKESIIADFNNKINIWCELYSQNNHLPKDVMCNLAVLEFKDVKSESVIRKAVYQEYKPKYRVENAKLMNTISKSDKKLLARIKEAMISNAGGVATPFYETLTILTKNGKKD